LYQVNNALFSFLASMLKQFLLAYDIKYQSCTSQINFTYVMARPSAIYKTAKASTVSKTRYKFPILDASEIIEVFDALDFGISEDTLVKPTPSFMNSLIEQIIDKFLYISPFSIHKRIEETQINDTLEEESLRNAMNIVAAKHVVYKFMCDCGVDDFSIKDISKPEPIRVRIILSAIINFARFREERMSNCDELLESSDDVIIKYKDAHNDFKEMQERASALKNEGNINGFTTESVEESSSDLEVKLKNLQSTQQKLASAHGKYKASKTSLVKELETQGALYEASEKELEKIQPYIKESPEGIRELVSKMTDSLKEEQLKLDGLEQTSKKISVTLESFQMLTQEFKSLNKLLDVSLIEVNRHEDSNSKLKELKERMEHSNDLIADYSVRISQAKWQLQHSDDRIQKLSLFYEEKMASLEKKINYNQERVNVLITKKADQEIDADNKRTQIEDWKGRMAELRRSFEFECKEANFELNKLESHMKLYKSEMVKKIKTQKQLVRSLRDGEI